MTYYYSETPYFSESDDEDGLLGHWASGCVEQRGPLPYNIFTHEHAFPIAMAEALSSTRLLSTAFKHLTQARAHLDAIPGGLKTTTTQQVEKSVRLCLQHDHVITQDLHSEIDKVKELWLPTTVDQLYEGAYQAVRFAPKKLEMDPHDTCVVCQEEFSSDLRKPVQFFRRCTRNPLLRLACDQDECSCSRPTMCLGCCLDHVLKNCILERRSSVRCPSCRGEFCLYDIQEIEKI